MGLLFEIAMMLLILDIQARKDNGNSMNSKPGKGGFVMRANLAPRSIYSKHVLRPVAKEVSAPLVTYKDVFIPGASGKPTLG